MRDTTSSYWRSRVHDEIDNTRRKNIYRREIKECRQQYEIEAKKDREILAFILHQWRELKELRQEQGFQSTPVKLIIHYLEV